jgi:S-adenosylmethionine hydrolase
VVLRVDRFGNLVSNIDRRLFERVSGGAGALEISAGGHAVPRVVQTYADAAPGELCALVGSTDHVEIAVNAGSAAERLGLGRGAPVVVAAST